VLDPDNSLHAHRDDTILEPTTASARHNYWCRMTYVHWSVNETAKNECVLNKERSKYCKAGEAEHKYIQI